MVYFRIILRYTITAIVFMIHRGPFMRLKQTLTIAILLLTACGPQATVEPARSTITPVPTFTSTPEVIVTAVDTAADSPPPPQADTPTPMEPTATPAPPEPDPPPLEPSEPDPPPLEPLEPDPPPPEPPPTAPVSIVATPSTAPLLTVNQYVNVRQGPSTTHPIIEMTTNVQEFSITGKNSDGTWWQIDYKGQPGWVFGQLGTAANAGGVQVVAIPTPPPAPPTQPAPTPVPPTPAPGSSYEFNIAVVQRCDPQQAGNWFEGTTYKNGTPANGYRVVYSWTPDGSWTTQPVISGPHPGYDAWDPGYYSHIIRPAGQGPIAGNWFVWIVNDENKRISEIANFQTTGPGDGCNQAVVDFDSR